MNKQELANKLLLATVESFALMTKRSNNLDAFFEAYIGAVSSRAFIGKIQFEDAWQEQIDETEMFYCFTKLKLSPIVLSSPCNEYSDLNTVEWKIILPNINYLKDVAKPKQTSDYLQSAQIEIEENRRIYEDEDLSKFLDKVELPIFH